MGAWAVQTVIPQKRIDKTVNTVYIVNIQKEQMKGMME